MAITLNGSTGGTASAGWYAQSAFTGTFSDGIVLDYTTGMGRISVGASDGLTVYNGGVASSALLTIDSSGNMGLGVTPSGWSGFKAIQVNYASLWGGQNSLVHVSSNAYYDGSVYKYISSDYAQDYYQFQGAHVWRTAASGTAGAAITFTQAMTLDASGRLQIGGTTAYDSSTLAITSATGQNKVAAFDGGGSGARARLFVNMTALNTAMLDVDQSTGVLAFGINGSERARIDSSGNLLVGTTSTLLSGPTCQVVTGTTTPFAGRHSGTTAGKYWYFGPNSGNNYVVQNQSNTGAYITDGGTSWTGTSDERLKTDLKPIENAAAKVSSLRAVTGRFKTDAEDVSRAFLIAQDVLAVLPEAVDASDPDKLGVAYTDTIPLLVAAIKELTARLEILEAK